jgi:hypothetical protein
MDELREQAYFQMGDENEKIFTPILKEKFGEDIRKTFHMKSVLDFESPTHFIELKSRTYRSNAFKEWMIGDNKRQMGMKKIKQGKKVFFVFAFKEGGTFYWELTEENFEAIGGMKQVFMDGTDGRGYNDFKPHLHIPLSAMTKLSDKCSYTFSLDNYKQSTSTNLLGKGCLLKSVNKVC